MVLQNLPVLFAIDRAGLVGADGATHNGSYDLSYLRCLPNMVVMAPADENECRQMLYTGYMLDQPAAVRYPRGTGPGVAIREEMTAIPIGKAEIRRQGRGIAILAFGAMVQPCLEAGEELDATVVNMRFIKPVDSGMLLQLVNDHDLLVTVEENVVQGGAGGAVSEVLNKHGITVRLIHHGLPDKPLEHGSQEDMLAQAGLTKEGILAFIHQHLVLEEGKTARTA